MDVKIDSDWWQIGATAIPRRLLCGCRAPLRAALRTSCCGEVRLLAERFESLNLLVDDRGITPRMNVEKVLNCFGWIALRCVRGLKQGPVVFLYARCKCGRPGSLRH